jgi:putative membrane protein
MKQLGVILGALFGLLLATGVIAYFGFGAVLSALGAIGWRGFFILSWFVLAPDQPPSRYGLFVWARMVRDAASEHLPFSQFGGFVIGARVAILHGICATQAFSTTVVDATAEMIAQIGFIGLGLGVLALRLGGRSAHSALLGSCLLGLVLFIGGAVAFIALQRRGSGLIDKLAKRFLPAAATHAGALTSALNALYQRPVRVGLGVAVHLAAWTASATGAWLALRLTGVHLNLVNVLAIEALLGAVRSAAFAAPMGVGVQEAGYALIGPLFGLAPDMALALSLLKRARDLAIGLPTLLIWQGFEAHRMVSGAAAAKLGAAE